MPNPISKTHADWLSLIEISGPFISMPILSEVFPQGLEDVPPELARGLRADFEFWQESSNDPAVHSAWVRYVLETVLGYSNEVLLSGQAISAGLKAEFPEHEETVRPDFVLVEPKAEGGGERMPKLLIQVFPPEQDLGKAAAGSRWAASVGTRMMELLHAAEIRLGLVTNGEQWMLVDAPRGETTGFTTWYASLWFDERSTLNAFQSLLGVRRFFGVAEDETLENLLARSANHQQEITDQLGLQVRHAVEILVQSVDKAEQNAGKGTGHAVPVEPDLLYEAALTVMMRLVFLLSAEERKLLPIDDDQYANYYAVSTLREQLQTLASQHGEEVLERRFDAWSRLLAVFRAVHGGIHHQELNLPAYGGSLFDPERYPFLEGRGRRAEGGERKTESVGRKAEGGRQRMEGGGRKEVPLAIDNRTVLHLLDALQTLRVDGEMRRLSFRALDVEQIGHVYEGLLDHKAVRAVEVMLGLGGAKRLEPEVALSKLEQVKHGGEAALLKFLKEETLRSLPALTNALQLNIQNDMLKTNRLRSACGNDDALLARIAPFGGLIRMDDFGNPAVILPGSVYVTAGTSRRATGSHYTPRSLTEPIVQHTLEPLVYTGVAEGLPREEWKLRSAEELLDLKICDMAMGSAGFLVQVVRYMAERLIEAWGGSEVQKAESEGRKAEGGGGLLDVPALTDEDKLNYARRLVAERCVYGVDKNPLAVEIAKLSLWLVTLAKEKPFTFLDHALKCGDSLVGTSADDFLRWANRNKTAAMSLDQEVLREELEKARGLRKQLESFVALDVRDAERKAALLLEADAAMAHVKRGADLLAGVKLLGLSAQDAEDLQVSLIDDYVAHDLDGDIDADKYHDADRALNAAKIERVFHWEFEFPEVFERGGFDAFVSNPPFIGGQKISGAFGDNYYLYLKQTWNHTKGSADYSTYFFLRGFSNIKRSGILGLIATNTIAQGATRELGLAEIEKWNGEIIEAVNNYPWPGTAAVFVSIVYVHKGHYLGQRFLDGKPVNHITSFLNDLTLSGKPYELLANSKKGFQGSNILGGGFTMSAGDAQALIKKSDKNSDVLFPYLTGQDLNSSFSQVPEKWVINFFEWPLSRNGNGTWATADDTTRRKWLQKGVVPKNYPEPVAEDIPDCIEIVREKVYPERKNNNNKQRREIWWRFTRPTIELYDAIKPLKFALCKTIHSPNCYFEFVSNKYVYQHSLIVFAIDNYGEFAVLSSTLHEIWAWQYSSTLGSDTLRYGLTECFMTFPFPQKINLLNEIGKKYHEHRRQLMLARHDGLTDTHNRFHNPEEGARDIVRLRELHVEMDKAVASAYGWDDLVLGHDFHETAQGTRFTVSESARREILSRLLKLNHWRWEEEQKAEEEEEKAGAGKPEKVKKPKAKSAGQMGLL